MFSVIKAFCMSQLITLRQRIKAVETIRKTTNAMRLIAMSSHTRLKHRRIFLDVYQKAIDGLISRALHSCSEIPQEQPLKKERRSIAYIVIGSEKGLCGGFNSTIAHTAAQEFKRKSVLHSCTLIVVGRQLEMLLSAEHHIRAHHYLPSLTLDNFARIAQEIAQLVSTHQFDDALVVGMYPKSFFVHKLTRTALFSQETPPPCDTALPHGEHIHFEEDPAVLVEYLKKLKMRVTLETRLFESLLAEAAARFLSMDNATRNAENLIASMRLDYNKLRQATITRELTDLAGGMI